MPELPEVQTVVDSLQKIKHKKIESFTFLWHKVCYNKKTALIKSKVRSKTIHEIFRLGKYIIIKLSKGYIIFHLRMTGYLYFSKKLNTNKYIRCYFKLDDLSYLIFEDIRKFGGFYYKTNISFLRYKIGVDPIIDNKFTKNWLNKNLNKKNRQLKSLLLDQSFICGLGNIYIDEILFKSKIHPLVISSTLKKRKINSLYDNILSILNHSIKHHGTTIMNFKFDNMKTGSYKNKLNVYSRDNKNCIICNNLILKLKVAGRGTYICPNCQKQS